MQKLLLLTSFLFIVQISFSQSNQFAKKGDSDPLATSILEKVKKKYDSYKTLEATFELVIEIPESPVEEQSGRMVQKGEKYRLEMEDHVFVSDAISLWVYFKKNQEVQINDAEESEDGEIMSPKDLLRVYESDNFVYALVDEIDEGGKVVQQIEFKPLDPDAEYFKIRLTINKQSSEIMRMKAFAKDGSRYTMNLTKMTPNKDFADDYFIMKKSECADCHWEDLRI